MIRQNVEIRQEFEAKIQSSGKDAEDKALQRAEELLAPQMRAISERLQELVQAAQLRVEEAFPKISEVSDLLGATRSEIQPLQQRADAAAARLDRVAVETSTTSKDCQDLSANFKNVVDDIRAKIATEARNTKEMDVKFKAALEEGLNKAAAATQASQDKGDMQHKEILAKMVALEERFQRRLDDFADRSLKEMKLGDEDVMVRFRAEIQQVNQTVQKRSEEAQEHAEGIGRGAISTLRSELDASSKHAKASSDRNLEQKARDLIARMNEGFEGANRRSDTVKEQGSAALYEANTVIRKTLADTRSNLLSEMSAMKQLVANAETRIVQVSEELEAKLIDVTSSRIEDIAADIRVELNDTKVMLQDQDQSMRQGMKDLLDEAVSKLDKSIEWAVESTTNSSSLSLGQAIAQLQSEMANTLKASNELTDNVRCGAADALGKEVQARREALLDAQKARESLTAVLRDELKAASTETVTQSVALTDKIQRRLEASNQAIKSMEIQLAVASKERTDDSAALRIELKTDRQRNEELATTANQLTQQVRDNLETYLQNEAGELRVALADARKKIYEESNALRAELREQPSKRELVELASTTTEQYNEINKAIDTHRSRLELAVAESGTRVREARSEASEARLRMQRETMALGAELTTLRAASSSLASGVLKSLQVIGFIRDDVEVASGKDGSKASDMGGGKEHTRGIEIEDLLEWEKVGKSLATRVSRQWYLKESNGIATMLSLVDRKAEAQEVVALKTLIQTKLSSTGTVALNEIQLKLDDTSSTMAPFSPSAPKSEGPPNGVNKAREQRMQPST